MSDILDETSKQRGRTLIIGASTELGQSIAVLACLNGHSIVLADDDLSKADRLAEWMRSIGGSVTVETSQIDRFLLSNMEPKPCCIIDARIIDQEQPVLDIASEAARMLDDDHTYARLHIGDMGTSLREGLLAAAGSRKTRNVTFVILQVSDERPRDFETAGTIVLSALSKRHGGLVEVQLST